MRSLLICALLTVNTMAATYCLDNSAPGPVFDGSRANPWQTILQAQTFLHDLPDGGSGDTVLVAAGDSSYGEWVDGALTGFTEVQRRGVPRTDWHVIMAADPDDPPEFYHIRMYRDRDAYLEFNNIKVVSRPPHRYDECINVRNVVRNVRFLNLEVTAEDDSTALPDGFNFNHNTGTPPVNMLVENCYVHHLGAGIKGSADSLVARNNQIYNLSSSAVKTSGTYYVLVEGNHIHVQDSRITQINLVGPMTGTFSNGDHITQDVTGVKGYIWRVYADHIKVYPENRVINHFIPGYTVRADSGHASLELDSTSIHDRDHGSGLSVRNGDNYIGRGNVIHDFGTSGSIFMYGSGGPYNNVVIENNLIYDPLNRALVCESLGDGLTIRNNTILGSIGIYYSDNPGGDGTGFYFYNNIAISFGFANDPGSMYENLNEGGNILRYIGASWRPHGPFSATSTSISLNYEGYDSAYFYDSLFVDFHNDDLYLREGCLAVDFGDAANAPATDLMGFARTAVPDAGCFEYDSPYSGIRSGAMRTTGAFVLPNPVRASELRTMDNVRITGMDGRAYRYGTLPGTGLYLVSTGDVAVARVIVME